MSTVIPCRSMRKRIKKFSADAFYNSNGVRLCIVFCESNPYLKKIIAFRILWWQKNKIYKKLILVWTKQFVFPSDRSNRKNASAKKVDTDKGK